MTDRSARQQTRLLQLDELVAKIKPLASEWPVPNGGWIASVRDALGMSGDQLGARLGITRSSVRALELRERDGGATLEALRAAAAVLGCDVVYALIPKAGSFAATLRAQAELADADRQGTDTTGDRDERLRDLMHRRPRGLWKVAGNGHANDDVPRRKGKKPGRRKGGSKGIPATTPTTEADKTGPTSILFESFRYAHELVRSARDSNRAAPETTASRLPSPAPKSAAPEPPNTPGVPGVPASPSPTTRPIAADLAVKAKRHRPGGALGPTDAEQLDAFA